MTGFTIRVYAPFSRLIEFLRITLYRPISFFSPIKIKTPTFLDRFPTARQDRALNPEWRIATTVVKKFLFCGESSAAKEFHKCVTLSDAKNVYIYPLRDFPLSPQVIHDSFCVARKWQFPWLQAVFRKCLFVADGRMLIV